MSGSSLESVLELPLASSSRGSFLFDKGYSLSYITLMQDSPAKRPSREASYTVEGHIWVEGVEGTFLGVGRVLLLEKIKEYGSITRAAGSLEMSYRKAWELVESMNRQAGAPLVVATTGGKGGGGAVLTEAGERAIKLFGELDAEFKKFLEKMSSLVKKGV